MNFSKGPSTSFDGNKYSPAGGQAQQPTGKPLTVTVSRGENPGYGGYFCVVKAHQKQGSQPDGSTTSETIYERSH